jgi:hypothetical protein
MEGDAPETEPFKFLTVRDLGPPTTQLNVKHPTSFNVDAIYLNTTRML